MSNGKIRKTLNRREGWVTVLNLYGLYGYEDVKHGYGNIEDWILPLEQIAAIHEPGRIRSVLRWIKWSYE